MCRVQALLSKCGHQRGFRFLDECDDEDFFVMIGHHFLVWEYIKVGDKCGICEEKTADEWRENSADVVNEDLEFLVEKGMQEWIAAEMVNKTYNEFWTWFEVVSGGFELPEEPEEKGLLTLK